MLCTLRMNDYSCKYVLTRNEKLRKVCNECDMLKSDKANLESWLLDVSNEEVERLAAALNK